MTETLERTRLRAIVDELPDDVVPLVLANAEIHLDQPGEAVWPPAFFASGPSNDGRTDTSERVDEILAEGFGE
jgi:hypothetical protein